MKITGTKIVNGRKVNVWEYTDEEKEAMKKAAEEKKAEMEAKRKAK